MLGRMFQPASRVRLQTQLHSADLLRTELDCDTILGCICLLAKQRRFSTASSSSNTPAEKKGADAPPRDPARISYTRDLRKLRKQWQEQHAQQLAEKAEKAAIKDANKAKSVEAHRKNVAAMKELRIQINEEKRRLQVAELVQRQANAAQWRSATDHIYADLREQRRQQLLQESRDWITPEALDARIKEALENPVYLYAEEKNQEEWQTPERA